MAKKQCPGKILLLEYVDHEWYYCELPKGHKGFHRITSSDYIHTWKNETPMDTEAVKTLREIINRANKELNRLKFLSSNQHKCRDISK